MKNSSRKWAQFRFGVIGQLLSRPPDPGDLCAEIAALAAKTWQHPISGEPVIFAVSTIERWYYQAKSAPVDPVGKLGRKIRADLGKMTAVGEAHRRVLSNLYKLHPRWSYKLHADNLRSLAERDAALRPAPSYGSIKSYMKTAGMVKKKRIRNAHRDGAKAADARFDEREVRSFESPYVGGLWHTDFHFGKRPIVLESGALATPIALAFIDDRSRLICHVQWYLSETARDLVHGLSQAIMKRGLPRSVMTDNGAAMSAAEWKEGLSRLGIEHKATLPYSPHQNGKMECFWGQLEGRLMAMLEGERDLSLKLLNDATQAWVEMEYNRAVHRETKEAPSARFLAGPQLLRKSSSTDELRGAFRAEQLRQQRRSDGTVMIEGVRFEVPSRFRHLATVCCRYARWDLSYVHMVDERSGVVLSPLYPLSRAANADGRRRTITDSDSSAAPMVSTPEESSMSGGVAPLLQQHMSDYCEAGMTPAYLPINPINRNQ